MERQGFGDAVVARDPELGAAVGVAGFCWGGVAFGGGVVQCVDAGVGASALEGPGDAGAGVIGVGAGGEGGADFFVVGDEAV